MNTRMTKFERVRILGQRADQISRGAPPLVDFKGLSDALLIAEKELKEKKIPLKIRRTYPDGEIKEFSVTEMEID